MDQSGSSRPLLLALLHHDYAARDFLESGTLSHLSRQFDLWFIVTKDLKFDVTTLGRIAGHHSMSWTRMRLWEMAFGLTHLRSLDPLIKTQDNRYRVFQRGTSRSVKWAVFKLHAWRLGSPVIWLLKKILCATVPDFVQVPVKPSVALLPTGIKDPTWDDTVSYCKRRGIPSLTVTINWDNIAHKVFLQEPDQLGVWGEQGYLFARLFQRIPVKNIVTIGMPRFEAYRSARISKLEAKRKMGLPEKSRVILFAGSGVAFDEVSLVEKFEQAVTAADLPADLYMLYKPHPLRHPRAGEPALRPEHYRCVKVVATTGLTPLADYPILLQACDGLITPMSTMLLEGALMGLPSMGLVYDSSAHGDYSWRNVLDNNHLHPVVNSSWHTLCTSLDDFLPAVHRLLSLMGRPEVSAAAQSTVKFILHDDDRPYAIRLGEALSELAGKNCSEVGRG